MNFPSKKTCAGGGIAIAGGLPIGVNWAASNEPGLSGANRHAGPANEQPERQF
jgi:hypothetical protein